MKVEEKKESLRLRSEDGLSMGEIARRVGVSKGTVSLWVRDIPLTDEQKKTLEYNFKVKNSYESRFAGANTIRLNAEANRMEWQRQGKEEAKIKDWLHTVGCMLYWAEGHKRNNRKTVRFSNSELPMMVLFLRFLRECFQVPDNKITITMNCYTDVHSLGETEDFWLNGLGLPRLCLRKSIVNQYPISSRRKMGFSPHGTCYLTVCDVSILQRIYGAIQEYGGFEKKEW